MYQIIKLTGFTLCRPLTMTFLGFLYHLMGFAAPALVVAGVLWLALRRDRVRSGWPAWHQFRLLAGAGLLILALGWALTGADGSMMTYAALVLGQGGVAVWLRQA
jgi:hypothetical protein